MDYFYFSAFDFEVKVTEILKYILCRGTVFGVNIFGHNLCWFIFEKAKEVKMCPWCNGYRRRNAHGDTSSNPGRD